MRDNCAIGWVVFGVLMATLACAPSEGYRMEVRLTDGSVEVGTCRAFSTALKTITCGHTWHRAHVVSYRLTADTPTDSPNTESPAVPERMEEG